MSQYWNPTEVLQLCHDRRCIGYAPSQRRKCRNIIAKANVQKFQSLIMELAEQEPDPDFLESELREIARYGLCVAYHKSQADNMVRKWSAMMLEAYPPPPVAPTPVRYQRSVSSLYPRPCISPGTTSRYSASARTSSHISPLEDAELRTLREHASRLEDTRLRILREESLLCVAQTGGDTVSTSRSSASNMTTTQSSRRPMEFASDTLPARSALSAPPLIMVPVAASNTTSELSAPRATSVARSTTPPTPSTPLIPLTLSTPTTFPTPTTLPTPPTPPPLSTTSTPSTPPTPTPPTQPTSPQARHCERTHVRRLPLDDECPICYDDTPLSSRAPGEVVWCRSSCGRSVHATCFEDWRAQRTGRTLTCMVCREAWDEECECGGCAVAHVRKRDAEGVCSICRGDLCADGDGDGRLALCWCKSGCGRSVHRDCFDGWRGACAGRGAAATCTDCRAVWVGGCEC